MYEKLIPCIMNVVTTINVSNTSIIVYSYYCHRLIRTKKWFINLMSPVYSCKMYSVIIQTAEFYYFRFCESDMQL